MNRSFLIFWLVYLLQWVQPTTKPVQPRPITDLPVPKRQP